MAVLGRISAGRAGPAEGALLPDTKIRSESAEPDVADRAVYVAIGRKARVQRSPREGPESEPIAAMSGCRPLIKGFFGVALIVGAVMSSTFHAENRIRWP
jgi:hypothetical protein